jgi:hypothetical protein
MSERRSPFHCGSQHADWESANCGNCRKGCADESNFIEACRCPIQWAVSEAGMLDGTVSAEIYERMGASDFEGHLTWPCREIDPVNDDVAESVRKMRARKLAENAGRKGVSDDVKWTDVVNESDAK